VGHVIDDKHLFIVALDPVAGKQSWKQPASPGEVTPRPPCASHTTQPPTTVRLHPEVVSPLDLA